MEILGDQFQVLAKALDLRMVNHRVISSNIANVDTPGYQAQRMDFEASMQQAIEEILIGQANSLTNDPDSLMQHALGSETGTEPIIEPTGDPALGLDGNNVNMESQLGDLTGNSLMYQVTVQLLASKLRQIESILQNEGA